MKLKTHFKYEGHRDPASQQCSVSVLDLVSDGSGWALPPRNDLFNHSPDGFEWGYSGSGPAQLALAILAHHLVDENNHPPVLAALGLSQLPPEDQMLGIKPNEYLAVVFHQNFKSRVIANLPKEGWALDEDDIERLIMDRVQPQAHA
jgi:hypothetical protein